MVRMRVCARVDSDGDRVFNRSPLHQPPPKNATAFIAGATSKVATFASMLNSTKALASLKSGAAVDAAAPRFTGTVTCFIDEATGDVVGLQLGNQPPLCSTAGTPRSFVVPANG